MAGRVEGRRYFEHQYPAQDASFAGYAELNSRETSNANSPAARSRGPSPYANPDSYAQQSSRPIIELRTLSQMEAGDSNDNPLYELEDTNELLGPLGAPEQGNPNINPLYGNDPFDTSRTVCMTEFLKPKGRRPHRMRPGTHIKQGRDQYGRFLPVYQDPQDPDRAPGPGPPRAPLRNAKGKFISKPKPTRQEHVMPKAPLARDHHGRFISPPLRNQTEIKSYPPARFSPIPPPEPSVSNRGMSPSIRDDELGPVNLSTKRVRPPPLTTSREGSPNVRPQIVPQPRFAVQNVKDLVAAVRSDQNLLKAEVRRDGAREPRIPGDHDRYFAPRKGDIIVHFTPTVDNKLVEYFDESRAIEHLQPGDKLVRVKYDNYKIPDHLMITSKLYICNDPEWVYLGKAVQTIKTA